MEKKHGIQMIEISKENDQFRCRLTEEARSVLMSIGDKEIVVI